jgi:hypothetical protein
MELSGDDVAGVVDSFGALTRADLRQALAELAFKQGDTVDPEQFDSVIDDAIDDYQLVRLDSHGEPVLIVGPSAFPTLPEGTQDLQHILDADSRKVDRERAGEAATARLREEAALAIVMGEVASLDRLIDVSYDIEAWAPVDLDGLRSYLDQRR